MENILEAVAIEQVLADASASTRILLFVRLAEGIVLDEGLRRDIVERLRNNCSPRHVPSGIFAVEDIPRTRSGKITETAIRDVIAGREIDNRDALANPEALEAMRAVVEAEQNSSKSPDASGVGGSYG